MALIHSWTAPFGDGFYAEMHGSGMELVCGNAEGHHVDWRQWRTTPRVTSMGPGRHWRWLDHAARTVTMVRPVDDAHAIRFAGPAGGPMAATGDDPTLVAANQFDADGGGHWASYYAGPGGSLRRIVADGAVVDAATGRSRGVAASAGQLCTIQDDARFAIYGIATRQLVRTATPRGTFNLYTLQDGWIGHGAFADTHVISPDGVHWCANAYQDSQESVPRIVAGPAGERWAITSIKHPDGTMGVLLRPVGAQACIEIAGPRFAWLGAGYDNGLRRFTVAGYGDRGELTLLWIDADAERHVVEPAIRMLPRPAFVGPFFKTTSRYPDRVPDYPMNVEVITEADAAWQAQVPFIIAPDAITGVTDPGRVRGIYVAAEEDGGNGALDAACVAARETWRAVVPDVEVPPVVAYVTPGMRARPGWPPQEPDVYGPELYFDAPPSFNMLAALFAEWEATLPADRQWLLIGQAYDRVHYAEWMTALAGVSPGYLEIVRACPWVAGILWFSVNRPGGVADYPVLLQAHRRIFRAVPGAPARLEKRHQQGGDVIKVRMGTRPGIDYADRGTVGEPAFVDFQIESDSPVTEIRIDRRRDSLPGLTLKPGAELPDLRDLRGVKVVMRKAGDQSWHVGARNAAGEWDESGSERTIIVDP
jgi:hypothetical protein